jgi:predicted ribosomally synthesized peptide with nif11-like leader
MDEKIMQESLKQFLQMASQDQELQEKLKAASNREAYISLIVELGKEKGYSFTSSQVVTALDAAESEAAKNDEEASTLSEEELASVAGGGIIGELAGEALELFSGSTNRGCNDTKTRSCDMTNRCV